MRSTVAILAVAAATAPAFVSALPTPQSGSEAISLSTIDDGVKLVGDAANAVPAIKQAWDSVFHRELNETGTDTKGKKPDHHKFTGEKRPHGHDHHRHQDKMHASAHAARDDGSEAISLSTIDDGVKLVGDAANAVPAIKSAWDSIFHRELAELMARQDGSEAISLSTIDDGVKLVGDAANAVPAIKQAWDSIFRRELAARDDGSEAISLSTIDDGIKLVGDAANDVPAIKNAWDSIFHRELAELMARQDGSEAISLSTIDDGVKLVGDAANAVPAIKQAWDSVFHRELMARDDGSEAISLSTIDDGVKLVGDAANAVPAIKQAWDSIFRRELDARADSSAQVFARGYLDAMARDSHARVSPNERLQRFNRYKNKKLNAGDRHHANAKAHAQEHSSVHARSPITESEIREGINVADDAVNLIPEVKNAWDSVFHRRFLFDELD